jgi:FixJ family two-component response regulator
MIGTAADDTTIFLIDDDESLRRSLSRQLTHAGWKVEAFASALEFLERASYEGTGCVVLDVRLPEMMGPELHVEMVNRGMTLPVVFLTGHGDVPTSVNAMKRGAVDFLTKPVDGDLLAATIRAAIDRHAVQRRSHFQQQAFEERLRLLSPREREVLDFVVAGCLNKQIADKMGITLKTVKVHRARVMQKMGVNSVAALVHECDCAGITTARTDS